MPFTLPAVAISGSVSSLHRHIGDDIRKSKATPEIYPLLLRSVSLTARVGHPHFTLTIQPQHHNSFSISWTRLLRLNNDPPSIGMVQILRVDDSDPRIQYEPPEAWSTMQDYSGGTYHQASSENSSFFLLFRGE